ncbi:isochorismate synthase [Stenotrophomonas sp.]|uniref:isochorismate synthase n=1 Tax=Stenotrophomonas sp. TaxID=69392 RepID=UPI002FCB5790
MNEALHTALGEDGTVLAPAELPTDIPFLLRAPLRSLEAHGCRASLPRGSTTTLAARVAAFFATPRAGLPLLVGALPFDPDADDALHQPQWLSSNVTTQAPPAPRFSGRLVEEPSAQAYAASVAQALTALGQHTPALHKVVLARSLHLHGDAPIAPRELATRLGRDASVATYLVPLPLAEGEPPAWLVGATPELLVSRRGRAVCSHPLAGSARRHADPAEDARTAQALLASAKDHDEHRHVVEAITAALAPWCGQVRAAARPSLHATATMWHLGTRIEATLDDPATPVAALVAALHPTPAVCGTPRAQALATIAALEPVPRGFYAGAVGWTDADGDGDWYVAIRCAHVQGCHARVYAGAGIVADSQPALETAETAAKFGALLNAFGVDRLPSA